MKDEMLAIPNDTDARFVQLEDKVKERAHMLLDAYISAAVMFADLHDTSNRLIEKGCISEIVPWRKSREWFYWRLKRILLCNFFENMILEFDASLSYTKATCK
jgi:acetyl-CoA carboxylase/biotin carboxylase 1